MTVSFDPNLRPQLWPSAQDMVDTVNQLASQSDLVLPGLAEGRFLTDLDRPDDIARFYLDRGASNVILKLGPEGAWCAGRDVSHRHVAGVRVARVVDTVGAGDGFAVGALSALLEGLDLAEAATRGNAIGARVIQFPGDSDGLPRRHELDLSPAQSAGYQ
jgi:2-dehydro-3-deoxygluconokinase